MKFRIFLSLAVLGVFNTTTAQIDIPSLRSWKYTYALSETVNSRLLSTSKNNDFIPFSDAFVIHITLNNLDYIISEFTYSKEGNFDSIFSSRKYNLSYRAEYPYFLTFLKAPVYQFNMAFTSPSEIMKFSKLNRGDDRNLINRDRNRYTDLKDNELYNWQLPFNHIINTSSEKCLEPQILGSLLNCLINK